MSWPIPPEGAIADRYRRGFEAAFGVDDAGNPLPDTVDTAPDTPFGVIAEVADETHTELYLYQQSLAGELMPDTAQDWLPRHAAEWGVPRILPATALGNLIFVGQPGAVLPAGIEVSDLGQVWQTVAPATIPAGGAVSIPAEAELAGIAGNRSAGAVLSLVSAVTGLIQTSATVDVGGLAGGADVEDAELWRGRILARIRQRGAAGAVADYKQWAAAAGAAYVQVVPHIVGAGSVGVYVGLAGPAAPTPDVLARIDAAIQVLRPVTAEVITIACTLLPVPITIAVAPDTVTVRAAATLGLQAYFLREAQIGAIMPLVRLDGAIFGNDGEYTHLLTSPAADVVPGQGQLPVLGPITFLSGAGLPQGPG